MLHTRGNLHRAYDMPGKPSTRVSVSEIDDLLDLQHRQEGNEQQILKLHPQVAEQLARDILAVLGKT